MTPVSSKPDVAHYRVSGARPADFACRVKARLRSLRARLERRDAMIETVREANATLDPQKVGSWLVRQADEWIAAPCWAVVAPDINGQLGVLADKGLTPDLGPSVWAAATWVMAQGAEFMSADLSKDRRGGGDAHGSAIALPLACRNRTYAVLVGLDPLPSAAPPSLGLSVLAVVRLLLEPAAIALDNALAFQKAEALSVTDDLTGLSNSRYLNLVLRREEKRSVRSGKPLSVLFVDMDGFKNVNTNHGHLAGSRALVEAAAVIRGCARETDVVARFGGDEFSLILPDTGCEGAMAVAERIRDRLRAFPFLEDEGLSLHLTASIGIATLPDLTASAEELLKAADRAMYQVKDSGKDGIHIAEGNG
ncbi:MAG: sensor domain-containing diguanylate cyclase [Acidobacteria bacterium]|nr:sensor domain-containing diguanylate cyclase [Acidobacteriota bacterium]